MNCPKCGSERTVKKGTDQRATGELRQRYKCSDCQDHFYVSLSPAIRETRQTKLADLTPAVNSDKGTYVRSKEWLDERLVFSKYVITAAQSDTKVNTTFLESLKTYCKFNDAQLLIIPHRYRNPNIPSTDASSFLAEFGLEQEAEVYPEEIQQYLFENNINLHPMLKVLGQLKISATADNPLSGLAPVSKGSSIIIGHNQLQLTTLPVQADDYPVIMTTTGTISEKNYSISKQGYKAEFNHAHAAVVVEIDGDDFHIRHLNFDGAGFYDFNMYYTPSAAIEDDATVEAIVTGDEHAIFVDEQVKEATYGKNGIVQSLKPKYIVRHDVLDCYAVTHHHANNTLAKFKKYITGQNDIEAELEQTVDFIMGTTPSFATNILVPSNHTDHLTRWLNEGNVKNEPWNAKIYHLLMYRMLDLIEKDASSIPDPFQQYATPIFEHFGCEATFLRRTESFKICDIEIASHGDKGANGSRGSREQFANLPSKTIIGHSHSPGIEKGCYQVGTSTINMEYNNGPSSWLNTHCLIYKNGKRQLVNIINGKWRA